MSLKAKAFKILSDLLIFQGSWDSLEVNGIEAIDCEWGRVDAEVSREIGPPGGVEKVLLLNDCESSFVDTSRLDWLERESINGLFDGGIERDVNGGTNGTDGGDGGGYSVDEGS